MIKNMQQELKPVYRRPSHDTEAVSCLFFFFTFYICKKDRHN